jgi:hypothetical protein
MILSFMILSPKPGQNHEGQNHEDRIVRAPRISSQLANDFDHSSAEQPSRNRRNGKEFARRTCRMTQKGKGFFVASACSACSAGDA